jgi:hypothetical protein
MFVLRAIMRGATSAGDRNTMHGKSRGLTMRFTNIVLALLAASVLASHANTLQVPNDKPSRDGRRWWQSDWQEQYRDGLCDVTVESKRGVYKREIRCKDGIGASWTGEGIKEFRDGGCTVLQDAKRDIFKETVRCPSK